MNKKNRVAMILAVFVVVISTFAMPANADTPEMRTDVGSFNYVLSGTLVSPRSRCRDRAKREWKACRVRDRRRNENCDRRLDREKAMCDRLRG